LLFLFLFPSFIFCGSRAVACASVRGFDVLFFFVFGLLVLVVSVLLLFVGCSCVRFVILLSLPFVE